MAKSRLSGTDKPDSVDGSEMKLKRNWSVEPRTSPEEALNAMGSGGIKCSYTVGKKPETKRIQSLK